MKTREFLHGEWCTVDELPGGGARLRFDKIVALNGGIKIHEWWVSQARLGELREEAGPTRLPSHTEG
jgi:hypothetical protein